MTSSCTFHSYPTCVQVQAWVLQAEPEARLVVFSGDMVSGYAWNGSPGWYEALWRRLIQPTNAAGIPYATTLGNHDAEADLARRQIVELDMRSSNLSLTQQGPEGVTGASNYYLDIYDARGEEVAARVWLLDSMDRGCERTTAGW